MQQEKNGLVKCLEITMTFQKKKFNEKCLFHTVHKIFQSSRCFNIFQSTFYEGAKTKNTRVRKCNCPSATFMSNFICYDVTELDIFDDLIFLTVSGPQSPFHSFSLMYQSLLCRLFVSPALLGSEGVALTQL